MNSALPAPSELAAIGVPMACGVRAAFGASGETGFSGFVLDPEDLTRRHVVELLVDGVPLQVTRADLFHPLLSQAGIGDGCYGFQFVVPAPVHASATRFEARLANVDEVLPLTEPVEPTGEAARGHVEWLGHLRFRGWVRQPGSGEDAATPRISVTVDGAAVMDVPADRWAGAFADGVLQPVRGFDLELPDSLADGRLHQAVFTLAGPSAGSAQEMAAGQGLGAGQAVGNGQPVGGGAVPFLAFADPLRALIEREFPADGSDRHPEALRVELYDTLFPRALPFTRYEDWCAAQPAAPAFVRPEGAAADQIALLFLGEDALDVSFAALQNEGGQWVAGALPSDSAKANFDPAPLGAFMTGEAHNSTAFAFLPAGARLRPGAVARIEQALADHPRAIMLFADVDVEEDDGTVWPLALPAADYERSLEQGFAARCFVLRTAALRTALKRGANSVFRLANFLYDFHPLPVGAIVHLPGALARVPAACLRRGHAALNRATAEHFAATKQIARQAIAIGECLPAVRIARAPPRTRVELVVDAASYPALAERCLRAALPALRRIDGELIIILPPGKVNPALAPLLSPLPKVKVLQRANPRGAETFNAVVAGTQSQSVIFLSGAMAPLNEDWLDELRCRLEGRDAGAVAPLVIDAEDNVCDAGYVLGPNLDVVRAFAGRRISDPGYGDLLRVAHEVSALSFDCVALRPALLRDLGGLDGLRFPTFFAGIDASLRLRARGQRLVMTPNAVVRDLAPGRMGTAALGRSPLAAARARELRSLRARWSAALAHDLLYNPILTRDGEPYSALCWPPVRPIPRIAEPQPPRNWPAGL
ncbi:glycosyltransferase family 2 protein [Roseixanthobacter glucoisosaccharinicivorans]|uniref:glycosyltransferase family 2 protein n=1 Tax=Roseixanthobacter glucoisosaccharinicivorans TaxID=3119923 RepID=UPI00372B4C06